MWNLIPWTKHEPSRRDTLLATDPIEREFYQLRRGFDSLLQQMWTSGFGLDGFEARLGYGVEIDETPSHYLVQVAAPGFAVDDFDIHVSGNHLVVHAERSESHEGKNGSRRFRGHVQRMIPLPADAVEGEIEANYRDGILEVQIPKGKSSQARRIPVKSG